MAVVSLTALILAAATLERRSAAKALQQQAEELATLNDSSRTFLDNFEIASIYRTICRLTVTRLGLDVAWIEAPAARGKKRPSAVYGLPADAIAVQKTEWECDSRPRRRTLAWLKRVTTFQLRRLSI
jgi:hypothetical protein